MNPTTSLTPKVEEILRAINTLFDAGQIIELRAVGTHQGTCVGFYRDRNKLAEDAAKISANPATPAVYWTLQDVDPVLFERASDRFVPRVGAGVCTADKEVLRYRWLLIDCDPLRNPVKMSSTEAEKADALEVATAVRDYFDGINAWDGYESILADSGNGYHVLVRIDMEVSKKSKALYQRVLQSLDQQFSTGDATSGTKIDTSVFNPSRICKVYGTPVRKGPAAPDRPHRMAQLLDVPDALPIMPVEVLERIAAKFTPATTETSAAHTPAASAMPSRITLEAQALKMEQFLAEAKYLHRQRMDYDNGGFKWQLTQCPFNAEHEAPDSYAFIKADGKFGFHCSHNHCVQNKWAQFRAKAEAVIGHRFQFVDPDMTEPLLIKRNARSITPKEIKWLWQDKIPLGKLTLFGGNPDNGKSIVSVSLAAICSTEHVFPGCHFTQAPADVLMLVGEDDLDDTVVPRLMAAGADLDRIEFPETVQPVREVSREIRLDLDIPTIERALEENPNIRLITIDPISNYLGNVPMSADQDVRSMILMPLKRLAEKYNVAVVIVMHLNKKSDLDAINRVGGAMAFIAVCRVAWLFTRNVQEVTSEGEDVTPNAEDTPDTFSMLCIKNNIAKAYHTGLSYSVQVRPVKIEGKPVLEPYVVWGKAIKGSADDALKTFKQKANTTSRGGGRPNTKMQEATNWLMDALQDGEPHPNMPLIQEAKERDDIKSDTLKAAYRRLVDEGIAKRAWKVNTSYVWKLIPMHAAIEDSAAAQQSELIDAGGAI